MKKFLLSLLVSFCILQSCTHQEVPEIGTNGIVFSSNFESGSIGEITTKANEEFSYVLSLKNDNNDPSLPGSFRTWWYVKAENVPVNTSVKLEFSRLGFNYFFLPVYSYDNINWQYFDEGDAQLNADKTSLIINKQFTQSKVWIARTFPYTTTRLAAFLGSIQLNPFVQVTELGKSPQKKFPIYLITINNNSDTPKKTIWINARNHSAEVGGSYTLEGIIKAVLASDNLGESLRNKYIFKIVPMHNPDGVILGNYRTNALSQNLENTWYFDKNSPTPHFLNSNSPAENIDVNKNAMAPLLANSLAPVVMALNLHSSNSEPDEPAFLFPHFGSGSQYTTEEQNLWNKQILFMQSLAMHYNGRIQAPPTQGGKGFLNSYFPETWWWYNKKDAVNAITIETVYGKAGFDHWVTQNDWRDLGTAIAKSINDVSSSKMIPSVNNSMFKSPNMGHSELEK